MQQLLQEEMKACNVAVVSASASATGRPFIWKNRDHSTSYRHQVIYYPEAKSGVGGSMRLMGETYFNTTADPSTVCTGGANESGFAITNTTCIDTTNDIFDIDNVNTNLLEKALENCRTLAEFEVLAKNYKTYWSGKNISGIFGVIDAYGGAAIYEMWTDGNGNDLMFRKFDIDTGAVTDEAGAAFFDIKYPQTTGFNNRTNSNHTNGWIEIVSDTPREIRARQLLSAMKLNNTLTPRNIMRYVSKDVCGGNPADYFYDPDNPSSTIANNWDTGDSSVDNYQNPNRGGQMYTRYCISRYQTTMGFVVEGAANPGQANLTTMWVSLGEPSLSVFIPFFPYAEKVSAYAVDDTHETNVDTGISSYYWDGVSATSSSKPTCFLNLLFDCVESNPFSSSNHSELNSVYKNISLYSNNGCPYLTYPDMSVRGYTNSWGPYGLQMDTCIDYPRLLTLQAWTLPLEDQVFNHTEEFINLLTVNPELISSDELAKFSDYVCGYVYKNYSNQSVSYFSWNYILPDNGLAPAVISVDPANGVVNPPATTAVTVKFSEAIDESTINENTFMLMNGSSEVDGSVVYDSVTRSAVFTPDSALATNSTYTVLITTGIKDLAGLSLTAEYTSTFTLSSGADPGEDDTAPAVTTVNTGNGGAVFPVDGSIVIQFNEPMNRDSININTFLVFSGSTVVSGTVVYDPATYTATFTPDAFLGSNTTYTVDLTTGIEDESGNSLSEDYTWTFTTSTEDAAPTISSVSPVDKAVGVAINGIITAQFDKLMDKNSINSSSFIITYDETSTVAGEISYDSDNRTAIFTPGGTLEYNTTYTVKLTAGIKDNHGKFIADTTWTFTTASGDAVLSKVSSGSNESGCGCGSSAEAATPGNGSRPLLPGLVSLLGTMLFPLSLIWMHRTRRKKFMYL